MVLALKDPPPPPSRPMGRPKGRGGRIAEHQAEAAPRAAIAPPKIAPAADPAPHELDLETLEQLVADSPLKSERAKRTLALAACTLMQQMESIRPHIERGTATGEEHRALSGICSNLRRVINDLGLTAQDEDEGEL